MPLHIEPSRASQTAIKAIEALGGSVKCIYYNPLALRDLIKGRTDRKRAAPTRKSDIGLYNYSRAKDLQLKSLNRVVLEVEESGIFGDAADTRRGQGGEKGIVCGARAASTCQHGCRGVD